MAEQQPLTSAWAAMDSSGILSPFTFPTRQQKDDEVTIKILFCGLCHTDLHSIKNEWSNTVYPVVPGHEIVGTVIAVGAKVEKFAVGDSAGVGYFVGSCRACDSCAAGFENYCGSMLPTSNGVLPGGAVTRGGFADKIVVGERYAVRIPPALPLHRAAPLLCAGVTVYSPMRDFGLDKPGKHVGVVGLGGLGHVAVKFGKAFGMKVTVISTSPEKEAEAVDRLGADAFLVSKDAGQMAAAAGTMDGVIDTVSAPHQVAPLLSLLRPRGTVVLVGLPTKPFELHSFSLVAGGKSLAGSNVGGMKSMQEMLEFAAERGVGADVEVVKMDYVNTAVERLAAGDVRYRFVVDVAGSMPAAHE